MLGSDVAHLVALLKEPPFELHHLTGPRLGELGGEETRRLAVDVFSKLSPPGAFQGPATGGTLAEEGERTTAKLLEFLRHVKYKPEGGDESAQRKAWQLGDHDVVLPALKWVLDNRERCEKRAYVGHFMADYAVPGEYAMDPEIQDLMNNTHELQRAFVEAHKECEQARKEAKDPVKLKSQIADLEREREQVRRRIEVTKGKVAQRVTDPRELEELVALAQSLREEQAQEHELARLTRDQTERRDLAEIRRNRAATRIRELRTSLTSGSPASMLQQLADEVSNRKQLVEEKLPATLAKKRARLESVREILRSDVRRRLRLTNSPPRCASSKTHCRRRRRRGTRTYSSASRRRWPRRSRLNARAPSPKETGWRSGVTRWWASTSPRPRARRATAPRTSRPM